MSNKRVKCLRVSEHCFGKMVHIEGTRRVQAEFDLSDNVTKIEISKTFLSLRKCHFLAQFYISSITREFS